METVNYKQIILTILIIILASCSKDNEVMNQAPSKFEISIDEVLIKSASISWNESIDPEGSQVFYDVYLNGEKLIDNTTLLNFEFSDLEEGKIYSGKISASDPEGNETTVSFNFETSINQPPTIFNVIVSSKSPLSAKLEWTESFDPEGGEILYNVYLEGELIAENTSQLHHFFLDLKGLTTYSGYVEAKDIEGEIIKSNFHFLAELKIYEGTVSLNNQNEVESFGALGYNKIDGNLIIGSTSSNLTNVFDLSSLLTLQIVEGDIYVQNTICKELTGLSNIHQLGLYTKLYVDNNDELLTLKGLEGLNEIFNIYIAGNKKLLNFNGLNNLKKVTNLFWFPFNESLKSINDLNNLTTVDELDIGNNDMLENLKGLENLTTLDRLVISSNDKLQNLNGLNNLKSCNSIAIEENNQLQNLEGLFTLKQTGSIYISGNLQLRSLIGLESLTKLTNSITIQFNKNLETLEGINNIIFSGGTYYRLGIYENGKITNLDALSNYRFSDARGEFYVRSNFELIDFCGLTRLTQDLNINEINENTIFRWNKFNPTYEGMLNGECSK